MSVQAKCTNYAGCRKAYAGEIIQLPSGAPRICPECQRPLNVQRSATGGLLKLAPWAIFAGLLVAGGAYFLLPHSKPAPAPTATPTPQLLPDEKRFVENNAAPTATPKRNSKPPTTPAPMTEPPPTAPTALDESRAVRQEVEKRIDLMPTLSAQNRDKLYNSVARARKMQKVMVVPFASGQSTVAPTELPKMKETLSNGTVMKLRDEPTAVFVVLGYADTKGDPAKNLDISLRRAESVMKEMRESVGIGNITHAVAMGGQEIEGAQSTEKNRMVEIWAVLP